MSPAQNAAICRHRAGIPSPWSRPHEVVGTQAARQGEMIPPAAEGRSYLMLGRGGALSTTSPTWRVERCGAVASIPRTANFTGP